MLKLNMICGPYDRAKALIDGTVKPRDIELVVTTNDRDPGSPKQLERGHFDAAEFYTGTYMADLANRTIGYTAIPIFVKRMFRHSYMYVNRRAGIRKPSDLNGRRVGLQSWFTSAAIWARGALEDDWGLDVRSIRWVAEHREEPKGWKAPSWLQIEYQKPGTKQFDLLAAGEIAASLHTGLFAPNVHPDVDFLFPNHAEVEREYYKRTGFFPIMHTLLVKNAVLERDPWVAMALYEAWQASKQACYRQLEWERIHLTSLWYRALREEEMAAGGEDFYRWGFAKSRGEVDKMLEYCFRYGLTPRKHEPEELFHPSTLGT